MCVLSRHCGVFVGRFGLVIGMLVVVATAASTGAIALDEQRMAVPNAGPDGPKAQVQDQSAPKSDEGTEIRIPGLGKLGTLPKMDFGLELLYGANEQKGPIQDKTDPDDVQLRGTIKHRF